MDETKHPLKSLGIVGPLIAMIVLIANHIHPGLGLTTTDVAPAIDGIDAVVGFVLAIVGRWRATKQIALVLLCMVVVGISACATAPVTADGTTMTFAQQVAAFDAKAQADIKAFNASALTNTIAVGKSACGYLSEADGLFVVAGPTMAIAGVDPAVGATEAAVMLAVKLNCKLIDAADPTLPAVPQVLTAVVQVVAAIPQVKAALAAANPTVAAAATAPVAN